MLLKMKQRQLKGNDLKLGKISKSNGFMGDYASSLSLWECINGECNCVGIPVAKTPHRNSNQMCLIEQVELETYSA